MNVIYAEIPKRVAHSLKLRFLSPHNAHGTPALASDVGGYRKPDRQHRRRRFATALFQPRGLGRPHRLTQSRDHYTFLSDAAHDRAHSHLNWDIWAERMVGIARNAIYRRDEVTRLESGKKAALGGN